MLSNTRYRLQYLLHAEIVIADTPLAALKKSEQLSRPISMHWWDGGWHRVPDRGVDLAWTEVCAIAVATTSNGKPRPQI